VGRGRFGLRGLRLVRSNEAEDGHHCATCEAARRAPAPADAAHGLSLDETVEIAADGSWFRCVGSTERVDLTRRRSLRLLLAALATSSREAPGHAQSVDALVASGWPGERLLRRAAAQRVYVALSTLRRMGLKDVLVSSRDGYRLLPVAIIVP
jgi:hypothetical protein